MKAAVCTKYGPPAQDIRRGVWSFICGKIVKWGIDY